MNEKLFIPGKSKLGKWSKKTAVMAYRHGLFTADEVMRKYDITFNELRKLNRMYYLEVSKQKIKIRRRNARTTFSDHSFRKYSNLIKDKTAKRAEEIWVTDITYIRSQNNFSYLSMVTDAYTKKILGWSLRNNLGMEGSLETLRMALSNRKYPDRKLIHHSDRGRLQGIQYCSRAYIKQLKKNGMAISMTQDGNPYDNILAERVNNTVKNELLEGRGLLGTLRTCSRKIGRSIGAYNSGRPHWSLDFRTPDEVHTKDLKVKKRWKKKKYEKREKMSLFEKYKKLNPDNPLFNPL